MAAIGKKFAGTAAKSLTGARPTARILMVTGNITRPASIAGMALATIAAVAENINTVSHSTSDANTMSMMIRKHTVEKYCSVCNSDVGSSTTQSHSLKYGSWENDSDTQHRRSATCSLCGYSGYTYANHSFKYGTWANFSDSQHRRTRSCATCSTSDYEYAGHSFTYGKWSSVSDTQHKRTKTCSVCKASGEEYADHVDSNGGWQLRRLRRNSFVDHHMGCRQQTAARSTARPASPRHGKPNATATAPTSTPVKTGHAFKGWYTSASGGSLYNTVTITAAKTFYAQFTANSYSITWDLGNGKHRDNEADLRRKAGAAD